MANVFLWDWNPPHDTCPSPGSLVEFLELTLGDNKIYVPEEDSVVVFDNKYKFNNLTSIAVLSPSRQRSSRKTNLRYLNGHGRLHHLYRAGKPGKGRNTNCKCKSNDQPGRRMEISHGEL